MENTDRFYGFLCSLLGIIAEIFIIYFVALKIFRQCKIRTGTVQLFPRVIQRIPFRHGKPPFPRGELDARYHTVSHGSVVHLMQI